MLSELQTRKITRLFNALDADGNGYFEATDLDLLAERLGEGRSPEQAAALREMYRKLWERSAPHTRDGRIDLDGFLQHQSGLLGSPEAFDNTLRPFTAFMIQVIDSDGDGLLSPAEMEHFYRAYRVGDAALARATFQKLDIDGDGYISREEMAQHIRDFFLSSEETAPGNELFGPLEVSAGR
jgi:Ca2+-binding EF-hand superfamily protein